MSTRRALVATSAAQLAAGVVGQVLALRQQRAYDVALLGLRGRPENVARDSWLLGTGLSAPVVMLAAQGFATVRLAAGPDARATRLLGGLGLVMSAGYLVEREFRDAVTPAGRHPVVTPVALVGFALALAMAALGLRGPVAGP